jgi:eukaryotic-like serine/threonine-protein kinase
VTPVPALATAPGPSPESPPSPAPVCNLVFDTAASAWSGNFGRYLREQVKNGDQLVRVWVKGRGAFGFIPYRTPEGTSLEIVVDSRLAGIFPTWKPVATSADAALIDVRGGDLVLSGVQIARNDSSQLKQLLRVEDGHLVLYRCRLTAPGTDRAGGSGLIAFRAPGTKPLAAKAWPSRFESNVDRPVCRAVDSVLITEGDAITAEVGRGLVALFECAVITGGTALRLSPANVDRNRFDADLWLDHCSLAAETNFVQLGRWPGAAPGPVRPWLVACQDCVFLASYSPTSRESVLLRFEPNALEMGTLFWQGNGDAYEVANFLARTDQSPPPDPFPDVCRQWVNLWGSNHFRAVTGPNRTNSSSVKLTAKLRPGDVELLDLKLDPDHHPGRTTLSIGADLRRLPIPPLAPRGERKR